MLAALLKAHGFPSIPADLGEESERLHSNLVQGLGSREAASSWLDAAQAYFYYNRHAAWVAPIRSPLHYVNSWEETQAWSRRLADTPADAMGDEHFRFMGRFQSFGHAAPDTFEIIALEAFEQRLALSRKYGTWFSEQVSPGWRTGSPQRLYLSRWNGTYDRLVWSFGIQGHPRADEIWHLMRERLPREPDETTREFPQDVEDIEPALRPETTAVRSWTFPYHGGLLYSIYEDRRGNFFLCHTESRDIAARVRPRLATLWNGTLDRLRPYSERLSCLAEFEWLWYWTNPFVRGGATTGGVLSAFLQRSLLNEGLHVNVHRHFVMQDLYALSTGWRFYVHERVNYLSSVGKTQITAGDEGKRKSLLGMMRV
jgi:hypothetical protein